jgi:hypothetical protein
MQGGTMKSRFTGEMQGGTMKSSYNEFNKNRDFKVLKKF